VRGREMVGRNQYSEVSDIFFDAALSSDSFALAVSSPVVGQHPKRARKPRHDSIPVVMVAPRTVDEKHGCAVVTTRLVIEVASIDNFDGHFADEPHADG
jgi:hypothetical protein